MMDSNQMRICKTAVRHYGELRQIVKACEELAELSKELTKFAGGSIEGEFVNNVEKKQRMITLITGEMADVEVVMTELKMIFNNAEAIDAVVAGKIARLEARMGG